MKLVAALAFAFGLSTASVAAEPAGFVAQVTIKDAIGPATADYVVDAVAKAGRDGAEAVVLVIDTPGGLDTAMRDIIRAVLGSSVPVIGYVSPSGARAASAGTYILYATHIAAMAPGTNLGAATPVQIGGGLFGGKPPEGDQSADAMTHKIVNDAAAFIRGLADLRGRNGEWAEKAVRQGASLSSAEALREHVIDLVAADPPRLLEAVDGRTVAVGSAPRTLHTRGLAVVRIDPDWLQEAVAVITNPNVALILMLIGIGGIAFEFMVPGAVAPGVLGGFCLLLGLYALGMLPINYAGLGLLMLGIALMIAEAFLPTFGVVGIVGILAFVTGAALLLPRGAPGFTIAWPVVIGAAVAMAGMLLAIMVFALGAQRRAVVTGREALIGRTGVVESWEGGQGYVRLGGERWPARSQAALGGGTAVRVTDVKGITLDVAPVEAAKTGGPS